MIEVAFITYLSAMEVQPIVVNKSRAEMCFSHECVKVLVGKDTPTGSFELSQSTTNEPGYGGHVLKFYQDHTGVFAVHRIWDLDKSQRRHYRILSNKVDDRFVTAGCINVTDDIYDRLLNYRYIIINK